MESQNTETPLGRSKKRSWAWVFYASLAIFGLVVGFSGEPKGLLAAAACGAYAVYLYRGGRFVLWIF